MAESAGLRWIAPAEAVIDPLKSGGPSTCVLVSVAASDAASIAAAVEIPVTPLGELAAR